MGRVRYVGEVEQIRGEYFTIPDDLAGPQARRYIEEQFAEQQRLEQQQAEAERQNSFSEETQDPGELDLLREELEAVHQRLDEPDTLKHLEALSANHVAMQASASLASELKGLQDRAREALAADQHTLDSSETFLREVHAERDRTMALIKSNQKIVNSSISSTSREMANLRKQLSAAQAEIGELKAAATAHRQLINKAGKIVKAWEAREAGK